MIFDALPYFDVAPQQADYDWLFLGDYRKDFAFVHIKHENDLLNMFSIVKYEHCGELF